MGGGERAGKGEKKREIRVFIFRGRVANELVSLCISLLEWGGIFMREEAWRSNRGVGVESIKVGFLLYFFFRSF